MLYYHEKSFTNKGMIKIFKHNLTVNALVKYYLYYLLLLLNLLPPFLGKKDPSLGISLSDSLVFKKVNLLTKKIHLDSNQTSQFMLW